MVLRWYDRLEARLGTRGLVMALLGLMWIGRGLVILHEPDQYIPWEAILYLWLPEWLRVTLWVGSGGLAVAAAFSSRPRVHLWAWGALIAMPAQRAISYLWSMLAWLLPSQPSVAATAVTLFLAAGGLVAGLQYLRGWARLWRWRALGGAGAVVAYLPVGLMAGWTLPGFPGGTPWAVSYVLWWTANVAVLIMLAGWAEDSPAKLARIRGEAEHGGGR